MAQTLRSQVFEQMNRDVQSGLDSLNSSMQGLAQAKQAYDKTFESRIEQNINLQLENYQREIDSNNDQDQMAEIQKRYESQIASYLDDIRAPSSVRKRFNEQTAVALKQSMTHYREDSVIPMMWKTAVAAWEDSQTGYITQVGSNGDLDYSQKKEALQKYWDELGLANAPYKYVGHVTTIDEALQQMDGIMVNQFIDREYALLQGRETADDFLPEDLAEKAVSDLEKQKGTHFDVSTRSDLIDIALKRINEKESRNMERYQAIQSQFTWAYQQRVAAEGTLSQEEIFAMATQYGAVNPDGSLNRYWSSWFASHLDILVAMADYNKFVVSTSPEKDWDEAMSEYNPDFPSEEQITVWDDLNSDGSFNWSTSSGKKTYTFNDGSSVSTEWAPRVEFALNKLNISRDSKEAVSAVVNLVNAEGAAGKYEDKNVVAMVNDLTEAKYNKEVTKEEYQNLVMGYITNGWISQSDANDLDLWNVDTKQFQSMPIYKTVENEINLMVENALGNKEIDGIKAKKESKLSVEEKRKYSSIKHGIMQEVERLYNSNPQAFTVGNPDYQKALQQAYTAVIHNHLDKDIEKAMGIFMQGGLREFRSIAAIFNSDMELPASQRVEIQTLLKGFYDSTDSNYRLFDRLAGSIQENVNESLTSGYRNKSELLDKAAQGAFGTEYSKLTNSEKTQIQLACLRVMYEKDVKDVIKVAFGVESENMVEFFIDGIGPAYVDRTTGTYYSTDRDPNTTSMYYTGTLTDSQMSTVLKGAAYFTQSDLSFGTIQNRIHRAGRFFTGDKILRGDQTHHDEVLER